MGLVAQTVSRCYCLIPRFLSLDFMLALSSSVVEGQKSDGVRALRRRSNQDSDGRYRRTRKHSTWIKIKAECVWCGDDFTYYSPLAEDGAPKNPRRYCKHRCVSEARWEGRKLTVNKEELLKLYLRGWSGPRLAEHFGVRHGKIYELLKELGIARRDHSGVRICKEPGCGKDAEKRLHWRRDKSGMRILFGTRCQKHRKEHSNAWARNRSRLLDPLRGTRRGGRKPKPMDCPKCGLHHPTTRAALACCTNDWRVYIKLLQSANAGKSQSISNLEESANNKGK